MPLIKHEDQGFRSWNHSELYFGGAQVGTQYIPNVNDKVTEWTTGVYRVMSVAADGVPTLELILRFNNDSALNLDSESLLTALSHYQPTVSTSAFYDNSVDPAIITFDTRFPIYGSDSNRAIAFRGVDTSVNGEMISMKFNSGGAFVNNDIDLEEITDNINRPLSFRSTAVLSSGEVITLVVYNAAGGVVSKTSFLVRLSSANRPSDLSGLFITDVTLDSPLIDPSDDSRILNKLNTPFATAGSFAHIHYSDGSRQRTAIDGSKMKLLGVDNFDTSDLMRPTKIILAYYPGSDEPFINGNGGSSNVDFIHRNYTLANVTDDTDFAFRIYPVPTFVSSGSGYTFRYRLVNLERDLNLDITDDVSIRLVGGTALNTTLYGQYHDVLMSVNMDDVAPGIYDGHVHTDRMRMRFDLPSNYSSSPWLFDFGNDDVDIFGDGIYASCSAGTSGQLSLANGHPTESAWLRDIYRSTTPLNDPAVSIDPPTPTHFRVEFNGQVSADIEVVDYAERIELFGGNTDWTLHQTVTIVFLLENGGDMDVLTLAPLSIRHDLV